LPEKIQRPPQIYICGGPVGISVDKKAKDDNSKPMAKLSSSKADYLTNVLIPFFDSLT